VRGSLGIFAAVFGSLKDFGISIPTGLIPNIPGVSVPGLTGFATQELSFGGEGTGPGLFGDVRAIGVNPVNGNIYAANYDDGRIQVFDAQGKFQTQWIIKKGITDPYFGDMAVGRNGTVYVPVFGKILKFDGNGKSLGEIKLDGYHFDNLDIAADSSLVAIANGEDIVWLTAEGKVTQEVKAAVSTVSGDSELDSLVAVDGVGNVYVLGTFNNAVFVYNPEGKYLNRFGSEGDEAGQFRAPLAIEVDGQGRVFVSDIKGIQVFGNDGRYIDVIKVQYAAYGLAFDDQGNLYITTNQKKVEKYSVKE
jgi:DNA-binding beta-propeller fold protein YncE